MGVIETGERLALAEGRTSTVLRGLNNRLNDLADFDPRAYLDGVLDGLTLARRIGDRAWMLQFLLLSGFGAYAVGEWDEAVDRWQAVLAEDPEPGDRLVPLFGLLSVQSARGEPVPGAADEIEAIAAEVSDPQVTWTTFAGPATIASAEGRLADAVALWRAGTRAMPSSAREWLPRAARHSIRLGDVAGAQGDLAALEELGVHTPRHEAERLAIRAGIAALEGQAADALRLYGESLQAFRELGIPFTVAEVTIEMATVLDPSIPEVAAAIEAARGILSRLRAQAFLDQLETAAQARPSPARAEPVRQRDTSPV
jgi:tetratricopeptide (TPR) repeat protein